jgi:hypothetical protein
MRARKWPSSLTELIDALSAQQVFVGRIPAMLKDVEDLLGQALVEERKMIGALPGTRTIADIIHLPSGRDRIIDAEGRLRAVERELSAHLKSIRSGLAILERELGQRRRPGRPSELTGSELTVAKYERAQGRSWAQVQMSVNALRRELHTIRGGKGTVPTIPLTTIRTAVGPRHAKKAGGSSRMR